MARPRISGWQFAALAFLHTIGTSTLLMPTTYARQDTWLSLTIALAAGLAAVAVWSRLAKTFSGKTPYRYAKETFGSVFGTLVGVAYFSYFTHLASLVCRNVMEMYATAVLTKTPPVVFVGTLALSSAFLVRSGLEPLARLGELLAPFAGLSMLSLVTLAFATPGLTRTEFLLPVLEHGMVPVLRQAICLLAFPFGELVVFVFLMPATAHPERGGNLLAKGMIAGALMLTLVFLRNLLTLGPNEVARLNFPSLESIREIQLGHFFQRIEVLGIFLWTAGSFVKLAVSHYAAVLGVAEICSLEDPRPMVFPLAFLIAALCIAEYDSLPEMVEFAARTFPVYAPVIHIGLPLLLLVVSRLRRRPEKPKEADSRDGPSRARA